MLVKQQHRTWWKIIAKFYIYLLCSAHRGHKNQSSRTAATSMPRSNLSGCRVVRWGGLASDTPSFPRRQGNEGVATALAKPARRVIGCRVGRCNSVPWFHPWWQSAAVGPASEATPSPHCHWLGSRLPRARRHARCSRQQAVGAFRRGIVLNVGGTARCRHLKASETSRGGAGRCAGLNHLSNDVEKTPKHSRV